MLDVTQLAGFGAGGGFPTLFEFLSADPALAANLQICIDAGDGLAFPASDAQTITDRVGTEDAWIGQDGTADATDPTFNGVIDGRKQEYWAFDGGDRIQWKSQPPVMRDFVKQAATSSLVMAVLITDAAADRVLVNTYNAALGFGVSVRALATGKLWWAGNNALAGGQYTSTASYPTATPFFYGLSLNESGGAAASFININSTAESFDGNSGTGSNNAGETLKLGRQYDADPEHLLGRIYFFAAWNTNLSQANMTKIYNYLIRRFT